MAFSKLSMSAAQVDAFLQSEGFGLISWGEVMGPSEENALAFAVQTGLLNITDPVICDSPGCGQEKYLTYRADRDSAKDAQWCCRSSTGTPRCRNRKSALSNTWFDGSKLPISTIMKLTLSWFFEVPVTSVAGQCQVAKSVAIDWYNQCRQICFSVIMDEDICIGGEGLTVEIDETHVWVHKNRRGRILRNQDVTVFGGICRESKEAFAEFVPNVSGATLWPIIRRRIAEGTIIMSDEARVYDNLHRPDRGGYEHYQVTHKYHFVHPNDRNIHTNSIERQWGLIKKSIKGFSKDDYHGPLYLGEYEYRRRHLKASTDRERRFRGDHFKIFLQHIVDIFPGPGRQSKIKLQPEF